MTTQTLLSEIQKLQSNYKLGVVSIMEASARLWALSIESGCEFSDLYNAFDSDQPELIINMV